MRKSIAALVGALLITSACSSDASGELPGEPVCIPEGTETPAPEYLGLDEEAATALAEEQNLTVREVGRDGECGPITMDLRTDRINLEFIDEIVVGAAKF